MTQESAKSYTQDGQRVTIVKTWQRGYYSLAWYSVYIGSRCVVYMAKQRPTRRQIADMLRNYAV